MKVLFFSHQAAFLYGGEIVTLAFLRALKARGVEVHFAAPAGPYLERARAFAVTHEVPSRQFSRSFAALPGLALSIPATVRALDSIMERHGIDILHATSLKAMAYAWPLGRKRKVLWHHHDILPEGFFNNAWVRGLARRAKLVLAPSAATRDSVVAAGVPAEKCMVLANGFQPSEWRARPARKSAEYFHLAMVGEISSRKGVDRLPGILGALRYLGGAAGVRISLVGDGLSQPEFSAEMKQVLRDEPVSFLGRRENVKEILQGVDLLLVPSRQDPLPTVIVEAFLSGVPVVGSRAGGIPEMIREAENGFLAEKDEEFAEAIIQARDPVRWLALSESARSFAEAHYDIDALSDRLAEIYAAPL